MNILPYRLSEIYDNKTREALFQDVIAHYSDPDLTALLWAIDGAMTGDPETIADLKSEIECLTGEVRDMEDALQEQRDDAAYWRGLAEDAGK
jgi:hypothetical protein